MKDNLSLHAFFYIFSLMLTRGCGILSKIFLARSITPYEYGLITLFVLVLPGTMQVITNFCFDDVMSHATEGKKFFGFAIIYGTISTAIIGVIIFLFPASFFSFLNIPEDYWTVCSAVFVGVLFAVTINSSIFAILRGMRNYTLASSFSAAPSILRVIFVIFAVYIFNITNFYLILLLFALPPIIVLVARLTMMTGIISSSLKTVPVPTKEIMIFGFSFFILNVWLSLTQNIASIVISHDLGVNWQAYYDVSLSTVMIITFFASGIYMVSAPETTIKNNRDEQFSKKGGFGDIGRILLSMCLLCVLIIFFYSHQLITFLFTEKYAIAGDYLIILAIGYTVLFVQQFCGFLNISLEKETGLSRLSLVTIVSIVIFPFFVHLMILAFNFKGAYLATTIFIICYTLVTLALIKDRKPLNVLLLKIDRLIISFFITSVIIYLLNLTLIPGILCSLVVFTSLIFLMGYIDKGIIFDLIRVIRKKT